MAAEIQNNIPPVAEIQNNITPLAEIQSSIAPVAAEFQKDLAPVAAEFQRDLAPAAAEFQSSLSPAAAEFQTSLATPVGEFKGSPRVNAIQGSRVAPLLASPPPISNGSKDIEESAATRKERSIERRATLLNRRVLKSVDIMRLVKAKDVRVTGRHDHNLQQRGLD